MDLDELSSELKRLGYSAKRVAAHTDQVHRFDEEVWAHIRFEEGGLLVADPLGNGTFQQQTRFPDVCGAISLVDDALQRASSLLTRRKEQEERLDRIAEFKETGFLPSEVNQDRADAGHPSFAITCKVCGSTAVYFHGMTLECALCGAEDWADSDDSDWL